MLFNLKSTINIKETRSPAYKWYEKSNIGFEIGPSLFNKNIFNDEIKAENRQ